MKCTKNLIIGASGLLLYNCEKTGNTFVGLNLASDNLATINGLIADGSLIYLPFLNSADAISANNEDATIATDGVDVEQINSARIGINALLSSQFGTIVKALRASGAVQGYVVLKNGMIAGQNGSSLFEMIDIDVTMPSPMPNGIFVTGSLPNIQVQISFGQVEDVAEWRVRSVSGLNSADDLLELEEADLIISSATTATLTDFAGNVIAGATDISDAEFIYSPAYSGTPVISNGVITFGSIPSGTVVTVEGSISGYKVYNSIVF